MRQVRKEGSLDGSRTVIPVIYVSTQVDLNSGGGGTSVASPKGKLEDLLETVAVFFYGLRKPLRFCKTWKLIRCGQERVKKPVWWH